MTENSQVSKETRAKWLLHQEIVRIYARTAPDGEVWDPPTEEDVWAAATELERLGAIERANHD